MSGARSSSVMSLATFCICSPGLQGVAEERQGTLECLLEKECKVFPISGGVGCHVCNWCFTVVHFSLHSDRAVH